MNPSDEGSAGTATPAADPAGIAGSAEPARRLRILLFLGAGLSATFERLLSSLLERGHELIVAIDPASAETEDGVLDSLRERYPALVCESPQPRRDLWRIPAGALRRGLDYLRHLESERGGGEEARERAREEAPRALRGLLRVPPFRTPGGRRRLGRFLRNLEAAMPLPRKVWGWTEQQHPDVVALSPLVELDSRQADYPRIAKALGVPTVLLIAGDADLTGKGVIRDQPELTLVRDEQQVEQAVDLHGLTADRIVVADPGGQGASAVAAALERGAEVEVVPRREGRVLRPVLWLLTPILVLLLPLLRPVSTARALVKAVRKGWKRLRKRFRAMTAERRARSARAARDRARAEARAEIAREKEAEKARLRAEQEAEKAKVRAEQEAEKARVRTEQERIRAEEAKEKEAKKARLRAEQEAEKAKVRAEQAKKKEAEKARLRAEQEAEKERIRAEQERIRAEQAKKKEAEEAEKERAREREVAEREQLEAQKAEAHAVKVERIRAHNEKLARAETGRAKEERAGEKAAKAEGATADGEGAVATTGASEAAGVTATKAKPAKAKGSGDLSKRMRRMRGRTRKAVRGRAKVARRRWKLTKRGVRRVYNRRYRWSYRSTIMRIPARDELPALLNARGLVGKGVEIGVKTGLYSNELLTFWNGEELISIDPWLSAPAEEYVDRSNVSQDEFEDYYQQTRERLEPHGSRSTIWRMTSIEAAPKVPDQSLDFVYIDARHDYESVKEDLTTWCSKVKPGGILAGHDYVDGDFAQGEFYVKSAVDEFFGERDIPVRGTEGPSAVELFPTWIVEVPESGIEPPSEPAIERAGNGAPGETAEVVRSDQQSLA